MYKKLTLFVLLVALVIASGCRTASDSIEASASSNAGRLNGKEEKKTSRSQYVFGWGNLPFEIADPRGGTTQGTPVKLAPARELPLVSIADANSSFEKDRAAILSLAGDYKASFHFLESIGLFSEHQPTRPYHSWTTEQIRILEDKGDFISLQHTLVMYFQQEDGSTMGPMVMKHWRQDWTFQDTDLYTFRGAGEWARDKRDPESVEGAWSQAVWQVDDSPRYEAIGRWTHDGNRSVWTGENSWRPLPRREYSVRDDYDVMEGFHRIVITPTGWLHEQNNWKRVNGGDTADLEYRGHELGLDRYELISSPSLAEADSYWMKTGAYWAEVRKTWIKVFDERDSFFMRSKADGRSQYEYHFEYAGEIEAGKAYDPVEGAAFARETIEKFLSNEGSNGQY